MQNKDNGSDSSDGEDVMVPKDQIYAGDPNESFVSMVNRVAPLHSESDKEAIVEVVDKDGCTMKYIDVKGMRFPPGVSIIQNLTAGRYFKCQPDDIWVASFPRSGTHWVWEIVYMLTTGKTQPTPQYFKESRAWEYWYFTHFDPIPSPRMINTHTAPRLLPKGVWKVGSRVIVVMRNIRDVAVSFYKIKCSSMEPFNYKGSWDAFFRLFMDGELDRGKWIDFVLDWWNLGKEKTNILFVKYEDIKKDPVAVITKIDAFLGNKQRKEFYEEVQVATSFEQAQKHDRGENEMFAKDHNTGFLGSGGRVGRWKDFFNEEQNKEVEETLKRLEGTGLHFDC